ncbi:MAG TPA: nicotinamide riboside transporter PnuC [Longimicrobium sp.]
MSTIEWIAAAFGVVSVWLSVRENVWSWPTAIVNTALYVLVFRNARLYADMGLQVIYIAISLYGWYHWLHGGTGHGELRVSRIRRHELLCLPVLAVACTLALAALLSRYTNATLPYLDSTLTVCSLIAQWLMTRKILENWMLWVVLDVAYVALFIHRALYPTALLYAVFLVLAAMGHVQWTRSYRAHMEPAA